MVQRLLADVVPDKGVRTTIVVDHPRRRATSPPISTPMTVTR